MKKKLFFTRKHGMYLVQVLFGNSVVKSMKRVSEKNVSLRSYINNRKEKERGGERQREREGESVREKETERRLKNKNEKRKRKERKFVATRKMEKRRKWRAMVERTREITRMA